MNAYEALAGSYDVLTGDVPYDGLSAYYTSVIDPQNLRNLTVLDLCCGTGTLTEILAGFGYEMIGVDRSPEMLSVAQEKLESACFRVNPMYLCQEASELDLFGTVDAAICSLDGFNYIPADELPEVLRRLHLFIVPGGTLAFDIHSPQHLRELDGGVFVDESEDMLCLWRAEFDESENALFYGLDLFSKQGRLWKRESEEHCEYAHDPESLCALLRKCGFENPQIHADGPRHEEGRLFLTAVNLPH